MIERDLEIKHKNEDLLNRKKLARQITDFIISYENEEPLSIGITGKWGIGKTSLINLIECYLEFNIKNITLNKEYIIIHFDPWFFSNQNNLYIQFFKLLLKKIQKHEYEKYSLFDRATTYKQSIFEKLKIETLEDYINYLESNRMEPPNNFTYTLSSKEKESYESILAHKNLCDEYFNSKNYKIIIIIDNIDRLIDTEIKQIVTLVKSFANFKNFIYILSFDKTIVSKSLNKHHSEKGDKFLDKIVQMPIIVPDINEKTLEELILNKISKIYESNLNNFINENNKLTEILPYLKFFIKDLRDLKRFINVSNLYIKEFSAELNINDYTLLLALEVFEYPIFSSLKKYKKILIDYETIELFEEDNTDLKNEFENFQNENLVNLEFDELESILNYLFPYYKNSTIDNHNLHKHYRIGSYLHFNKYFTLTPEKTEVPSKIINKLIHTDNKHEITRILRDYSDITHSYSLWYNLYLLIDEIPLKNIETFIKSIIQCGDQVVFYNEKIIRINSILKQMIKRINSQDKCYKIIKESMKFKNNLYTLTELIYSISYEYGRTAENKHPKTEEESLVKLKQIEELEKDILNKLRDSSSNLTLLDNHYLKYILVYWNQYEMKDNKSDYVKRYIINHTITNEELISFVEKFIIYNEYEKDIDFRNLKRWLDLEEINNRMIKILEENNTSLKTKETCIIYLEKYNLCKKLPS